MAGLAGRGPSFIRKVTEKFSGISHSLPFDGTSILKHRFAVQRRKNEIIDDIVFVDFNPVDLKP